MFCGGMNVPNLFRNTSAEGLVVLAVKAELKIPYLAVIGMPACPSCVLLDCAALANANLINLIVPIASLTPRDPDFNREEA